MGVKKFRVKIDADNYASQRLFEKLGAIPYGIAEQFGVEPRKLLSHVLEYELNW